MPDDTPIRDDLRALMDDLKQLRDDIRHQIHLASTEAATRWKDDLEPRLAQLEDRAEEAGQQAKEAASRLGADLKKAFIEFKERLTNR